MVRGNTAAGSAEGFIVICIINCNNICKGTVIDSSFMRSTHPVPIPDPSLWLSSAYNSPTFTRPITNQAGIALPRHPLHFADSEEGYDIHRDDLEDQVAVCPSLSDPTTI